MVNFNFLNFLYKIEELVLTFTTACLIGVVFWGVVSRYLLKMTLGWYSEIVAILYLWTVAVGIAYGYVLNRHLSFEILVDKIKNIKVKKFIISISYLIVITSLLYWTYYGSVIVLQQYFKSYETVYFGLPMYIFSTIVPITGLLILITAIMNIINLFAKEGV